MEVSTDASGTAIGAMLVTKRNKRVFPVAFASRILTDTERGYPTISRELMAVILALKKFRVYLLGRTFLVRVDHQPLVPLLNGGRSGLGPRWEARLMFISSFNLVAVHIPGKSNVVPDALSRLTVAAVSITLPDIQSAQKLDPSILKLIDSGKAIVGSDGIARVGEAIALPAAFRYQALIEAHAHPTGGHFGFKKTLARLRLEYFWPGMSTDVLRIIAACGTCQQAFKTRQETVLPQHLAKGALFGQM